jgi:tryptophan halogenase
MKITIIGGGTAGWLSALWITKLLPYHQVTVIDSTKIDIIGVGEGTTGKFLDIIQNIKGPFGIDEAEFIRETQATQKMGIRFTNWRGQGESWISPIDNSPSMHAPWDWYLIDHWNKYGLRGLHTSTICGTLAEHNLSSVAKDLSGTYGQGAYHFDGHLVGKYFKRLAGPLCEQIIDAEVVGHELDSNGNLARVKLSTDTWHASDYWVDCSGFARVLAPAVNPGWHSYKDSLTCDSTLLFQTKHWHLRDTIEPLTLAEAMDSGWRFRIPTQSRYGNGYVFDSSTTTADQALEELQRKDPKIEARRTLKFEAGRMDRPFSRNVAFIGLSAVFLEPLQATSIHGTIAQLEYLETNILRGEQLPKGPWELDHINDILRQTFDQYADLIHLHYRSGRTDTDFWRKQTYDIDVRPRVAHLRELAERRWPLPTDFYVQRGTAGYPVFIYPILAYDWVNMKSVIKYTPRSSKNYQDYTSVKQQLAALSMPHSKLIGSALQGQLPPLPQLSLPRPLPPIQSRLHPLLR